MEKKFEELLQDLSAPTSTPGGGTASGLTASLSASLLAMVCNLTIGKKKYRQNEDEMKKILEKAQTLQKEFVLLSQKDIEVFDEVMNAYKLPKVDDPEIAARQSAIEEATKRACIVPMDILRRCEALVELCQKTAFRANESTISDSGVATHLAVAAANGAALNIRINLQNIQDQDFIGKMKTEMNRLLKEVVDHADETRQVIDGKI